MKDYTILLERMLGKENHDKLFNYTIKNIREKFGNINLDKAMDILNINHQVLLIISIFKMQGIKDDKILEILHWNDKKSFKYIVVENYNEFLELYGEYINLIVSFIKNNNQGGLV